MNRTVLTVTAAWLALAGTAVAQEPRAAEDAQMVCDLTGECGAEAGQPTTATPADGPPRRSGATRGFTFGKSVATGLGAAAGGGATAAASAAPAARAPVRPARTGQADLRLTFPSGSAKLDAPSRAKLTRLAAVLATPRLAQRRLRIEGHTDSSGNAAANRELSRRRAQAAADALAAGGVDRARIDVLGYGADRGLPGVPASSPANRRVMAVLL